MPLILPARRLRQLLIVYLLAVAMVTAVYAVLNARAMHPWVDGEWLINYSAGLVRRGLVGEGLLLVSRLVHVRLFLLTLMLQLVVYAAVYVGVYRLTVGIRWSVLLVAALVSPATLAFTVLDPPSSVRKEALLFAVLAAVLLALLAVQRGGGTGDKRRGLLAVTALLAVGAPALVLTHEALLCYLPYLFAAPFVLLPGWRTALCMVSAPALLTAVAMGLVVTHPGSRVQAVGICDSVSESVGARFLMVNPLSPCSGAIAYLGKDRETAHRETMRAASVYRYSARYPLPILLSLAPAAFLLRRRLGRATSGERRATWVLLGFAVTSMAASLPLFLLARDWGRWTHLHAMCLLLLMLAVERSQPGSPPGEWGEEGLRLSPNKPRRLLAGMALLLYATAWTLPAVGLFPGRFGYLDLYRYVVAYRSKGVARGPVAMQVWPKDTLRRRRVAGLCDARLDTLV